MKEKATTEGLWLYVCSCEKKKKTEGRNKEENVTGKAKVTFTNVLTLCTSH